AKQQRDEAEALAEKLQAALEERRRITYAAQINLATHAFDAGNFERARELLEQHRPKPGESDLRLFEWHYLDRLCKVELLTLRGHTHFVWNVAYSPDGKRLASAGGGVGSEVKVWDAQTGRELLALQGAGSRVAFSPDGKRLVSASRYRI